MGLPWRAIWSRFHTVSRLAQAYPNQTKGLAARPIFIRVDDRDSDDICYGFCDIHLKMSDLRDDKFTLILENVPFDDEVKSIAAELNGTWLSVGAQNQPVNRQI